VSLAMVLALLLVCLGFARAGGVGAVPGSLGRDGRPREPDPADAGAHGECVNVSYIHRPW